MNYAARVCEKLRREKQLAGLVHVFIETNRFKPRYYANGCSIRLAVPTDNTIEISHRASEALEKIYAPGFNYIKCGVILTDFSPSNILQPDLFDRQDHERDTRLMQTLDRINLDWGSNTLYVAASGIKRGWNMKRKLLSPCYTTKWTDIAIAY